MTYQSPPSMFGPGHRLPLRSPAMKGCDAGQIVVTDSIGHPLRCVRMSVKDRWLSFFDSLEIDE